MKKTAATRGRQDTRKRAPAQRALYVAFELSEKEWKLGFTIGMGQKPRERAMPAGDLGRLRQEVAAAKKRFGLAVAARVVSCYEAGREGFWLHRFLVAEGITNHVVDSSSIEVNRRARRAKSDGLDVRKLLAMLVRFDIGERGVWSVVRVPTRDEEDRRHFHRELQAAQRERTRATNRIRGLLANQGIRIRGRLDLGRRLEELRLWDGSTLPQGLRERLRREWALVDFLHRRILDLDKERRERLRTATGKPWDQVRQLARLRGIGDRSSWLFVMEFFGWRKFRNRREVGSLAGLTPTPFQSGETHREQGISKAGNRRVRHMAIEIAWGWLRYQPRSALSRWYRRRFARGGPRARKVGIVALARRLLVELWRYLETGAVPQGAALKP